LFSKEHTMKTNRRDFIKKTGLAFGAVAIAGTGVELVASQSFDKSKLANQEQIDLLSRFEDWVNDYIVVVEEEKRENREFKNNTALTQLPEEMEKWMPELKRHMTDKQFAQEYLKVSNKLTQAIDQHF